MYMFDVENVVVFVALNERENHTHGHNTYVILKLSHSPTYARFFFCQVLLFFLVYLSVISYLSMMDLVT